MTGAFDGVLNHPIDFGLFRLVARERLLLRDGQAVPLGSRALDLLIVLVGNAPKPVDKRELIAKVWPDVVVDEGSLRFHIAALRKVFGNAESGPRYILTLPGRGYAFVGEITQTAMAAVTPRHSVNPSYALPTCPKCILGRASVMRFIAARLAAERFVSIIGPGGIGKTTLAVSLGHDLLQDFAGEVCMVDLGPVTDPALAVGAVATALGVAVRTADASPAIIAFLRGRRLLLILDSCEHVIGGIAILAECIHREAPDVHLLVTSREALRVEGERVHRLAALEAPSEAEALSAEGALAFPAVRLFVERVAAGESAFELSDDEAPVVAGICRTLDGMPLAIELAAGRVGAFGIVETARLLDGSLPLIWRGRRTAHPRHQTLAATLDWSHALLLEPERLVLRRLAIFVGSFSLDAVRAVAANDALDAGAVLDAIAGLVAKSLVTVKSDGAGITYRLLDTTRAYALEKLVASGEFCEMARRHAAHFCNRLPREKDGTTETGPHGSADRDNIANVRAALEWCFGKGGDARLGADLVAVAAPLFLRMSLLIECIQWTERALATLDEETRGTRQEMELQAALGQCLMFTRGNDDSVRAVYEHALKIAERNACAERQVELLGWLHVFCLRTGDHQAAFEYARRCQAAAMQFGSKPAVAAAQCYSAISCHWLGRYADAEAHFVAALDMPAGLRRRGPSQAGFDYRTHAHIGLARTLWIRGRADQAAQSVLAAREEVIEFGQPLMQCMIFLFNSTVHLWRGDLASAEVEIDAGTELAERHSMGPYRATGLGLRGELAVRRGKVEEGVAALTDAVTALNRDRYALMTTAFTSAIAEGLRAMGRPKDGLAIMEASIRRAERESDLLAMPEMLRIRGEMIASDVETQPSAAEASLVQALKLAESTGALAWELRAATSLARLWSRQCREREAESLLASIHARFTEGFGTADLDAAELLLGQLRKSAGALSDCRTGASGLA